MVFASTFLTVLLLVVGFIAFLAWIVLFIGFVGDVFGRHDIHFWQKILWFALMLGMPLVGVIIYALVNGKGFAERRRGGYGAAA